MQTTRCKWPARWTPRKRVWEGYEKLNMQQMSVTTPPDAFKWLVLEHYEKLKLQQIMALVCSALLTPAVASH